MELLLRTGVWVRVLESKVLYEVLADLKNKMSERSGRGHLDLCFIINTEKEPISHRPASIIICMYAITELNSTHISSDFLSRSKEVIKLVIICNIIDFHLLFKESYHPLSHFTLLPPLSPLLPLLLWKWPRFVYSDAVHR